MKLDKQVKEARAAFTLIEMVGVLAVIALLAAILVPKVFTAINNARYSNTVSSLNAVKTAATDYFGKYGRFGEIGGAKFNTASSNAWDKVLVAENFLERPFDTKLGDTPAIKVVTSSGTTAGSSYCFALNGVDVIPTGSSVVVGTVENVLPADALELSKRMDGDTLSATNTAVADTLGRVTYPAGAGTVTIYLMHR
jgi:prepilin-type N-terminal cleavage/methylation domain-containing protein